MRFLRRATVGTQQAALQVIVNGLLMGLSEIAYLMLLMLIVFYFFAVIGLLFLKDNDPQNFGDMCAKPCDPPRARSGRRVP